MAPRLPSWIQKVEATLENEIESLSEVLSEFALSAPDSRDFESCKKMEQDLALLRQLHVQLTRPYREQSNALAG
jgi:hypothetical protein